MKAVNITAQQRPEKRTKFGACSNCLNSAGPRCQPSTSERKTSVKALRQKVSSKLRTSCKCRVTTPAMLHSKVTSSIRSKARR